MSWNFSLLPEFGRRISTGSIRGVLAVMVLLCLSQLQTSSGADPKNAGPKKIVLVAGKPSHPPRMHEFNAGVQILADCLKKSLGFIS